MKPYVPDQRSSDKLMDAGREPHVLNHILPDTKDTKYHLRPRTHNLKLTVKNSSISQSDFITTMLFKDVY